MTIEEIALELTKIAISKNMYEYDDTDDTEPNSPAIIAEVYKKILKTIKEPVHPFPAG